MYYFFFSDLKEADYKKRVYISVWHKETAWYRFRQDEFLGSTSFGILPMLLKQKVKVYNKISYEGYENVHDC